MTTPRRSRSLRSLLVALVVGSGLYLLALGVAMEVTVVPRTRKMQTQSEAFAHAYDRLAQHFEAHHALADAVVAASENGTLSADSLASLRAGIRSIADSTAILMPALALSTMPDSMRVILLDVARQESRLIGLLELTLAERSLAPGPGSPARRGEVEVATARAVSAMERADRIGLEYLIAETRTLGAVAGRVVRFSLLWLLAGLVVVGTAGWLLHRRLYDPLAALDRGLGAVARGDLDVAITPRYEDEIGRLATQFNATVDVLRQRRRDEARRARHLIERLGVLVEESSNEILMIDLNTLAIQFANRGVRDNLGYGGDELLEMRLTDLTPEPEATAIEAALKPLITGLETTVRLATSFRRRNTTWYPVDLRVQRSSEEHPVLLVVGEDVTGRRTQEDALRRSEERFFRAFHSSPDAQTITTIPDGRFIEVNEGFTRISGYGRSEAVGQTAMDLGLWPVMAERDAILARIAAGKRVRNFATRIQDKAGVIHPCLISAEQVDLDGRPHLLASIRDMTSIVAAEEALRRREAILEAVGDVANRLLRAEDWETEVRVCLARLGEATGTHRVYLYENAEPSEAPLRASPRHEWTAAQWGGREDRLALPVVSYDAMGLGRWRELLSQHRLVLGPVKAFPESEQRLLARRSIRSLVVVPIRQGDRWWGFIGLEDCETARTWSSAECSALQAAADVVGAALERHAAEETLRAQEERFRRLIEYGSDLITIVDRHGAIRYQSPSIRHILGYTPGERVGHDNLELVHPEDRARLRRVLQEDVAHPGSVTKTLLRLRARSGEYRTLESIVQNRLDDPVIEGVLYNSRDVTERDRITSALTESEERFRTAFDNAPTGIVLADMEGRIIEANRRFAEMIRTTPVALTGESILTVTAPEDRTISEQRIRQLLEEGVQGFAIQKRYLRTDGTSFIGRTNIAVQRDSAGRPIRSIAQVEDISEQVHLAEQLRQSQKMEAIGQLAGGVAHDFNNLLTVILAHATFIQDGLRPDDPAREDVTTIANTARRAGDLTRQLLTFARRQVVEPREVHLTELLAGLGRMLQRTLGEQIKLEIEPTEEQWPARVDPGQFEQVVLNLAVNARDAMPDGGRLRVTTENVSRGEPPETDGLPPGDYVCVTMTDTGVGMTPEVREHIFEPFFTTKPVGKGTGLGLATCYGIVHQAGGAIQVDSAAGAGATFRIYLPRAASDRPVPEPPAVSGRSTGRETLLLVEDDPQLRTMTVRVLRGAGYRVYAAASGTEALETAATITHLDLLVTDVVLPGMGGREVAEALVADRPGLRVLYMSGYTEDTVLRQGIQDHGLEFLPKPFTPSVLTERIRRVLERPIVPFPLQSPGHQVRKAEEG